MFTKIRVLACLFLLVLFSGCSRYSTTISLPVNIKEKNETEKLEIVNSIVNDFKYKSDENLYGKIDYAASPEEFLKNEGGDCEDYAIMKWSILKSLGIPEFRMAFIKVKMLFPSTGYHMILTYLDVDENDKLKILALDNRSPNIYEFNETNMLKYRYEFYSSHLIKNFEKNTSITFTN